MSFYNTGNPVPSIDPRDLDDNAKHIDELVNSTSSTFVDRKGVSRYTLSGLQLAQAALQLADYASLRSYSSTSKIVFIVASGASGWFIRDDADVSTADNGGTVIVTASGKRYKRWLSDPAIKAEWFGWPGGEAGAILNSAQAAAVYHGVTLVTYSGPHLNQQTPINAFNGIVIKGPGMGPEGRIRVATGVAIDAQYQTPNFEAQYASQPTTVANGVIRDFGLEDVFLDGNCGSAQSTPVTTHKLRGMGFRVYGARPKFRNVRINRQPGIGWYSLFTATPAYSDFGNNLATESRDGSYFENIVVNDTQYENFVFQGASDISLGELRGGWPANSMWSGTFSNKKSLMFPAGRLVRVLPTVSGSGYVQATTTVTVATDATTPPTVFPVVVGGAVDHYIVTSGGSSDGTFCTLTVVGDGTGATATGYINNWVAGGVVFNKAAEFGFVHMYNNVQGPAFEARNDGTGPVPRLNVEFLMGENSLGGVVIGDLVEYQIARCDTHGNGSGGGPAILPSLLLTSGRGGVISNWKERRDSSSGNGAPAAILRGLNNKVIGKVQAHSGYAGDAVVVGGTANSVDITVANVNGFAIVTDYDILDSSIKLVSDANASVWKNYANSTSISNINSVVDISAIGSVAASVAYTGLNNFSYAQWKSIRVIDRRSDTNGVSSSSQALFSSAIDLTITTEQTITIAHNIVRTPKADDIGHPQLKPNSSSTISGALVYCYVSATTSTTITVKLKLSTAGTGTGTLQLNIA